MEKKKVFKIPVGTLTPEKAKEAKETIKEYRKNMYTGQANYMRVIPNSHRWTDLNQILYNFEMDESHKNKDDDDEYTFNIYEPLTIEHLIIGLANTMSDRTKMVFNRENIKNNYRQENSIFTSVKNMIDYLKVYRENKDDKKLMEGWSLEKFKEIIKETVRCGYNLKPERKMERYEVYKEIDAERKYQDLLWIPRKEKNDTPDEEKSPAEWINYIEYQIAKAKEDVYLLNKEEALAHVRKIAALAVRCLELHGCPKREIPQKLLDQQDA